MGNLKEKKINPEISCHFTYSAYDKARSSKQRGFVGNLIQVNEEKLTVPYIQINLSNECNLHCPHCSQSTGFVKTSKLSMREITKIFEIARSLEAKEVTFSGGEPLLCKRLFFAIKQARDSGLGINIRTNGTLITESLLKKMDGKVKRIEISLDGHLSSIHDKIRAPGCYEKICKVAPLIKEHEFTFAFITTITKSNGCYVEDIINKAISLKADIIGVNAVIPTGNALINKEILLSPHEKKDLYETLHKVKRKFESQICIISEDPLFHIIDNFKSGQKKEDIIGGCIAGRALMFGADGYIYPCSLLPIPVVHINDENVTNRLTESSIIKNLIQRKVRGKCGKCYYKELCMGCRAAAFGISNDYLSEDPSCWLELDPR